MEVQPWMQSSPSFHGETSLSSSDDESETYQSFPNSPSHNIGETSDSNLVMSHLCVASFKAQTSQISYLAIHNKTLYAAATNEINVFDLRNYELIETFGTCSGLVKSIAFCGEKVFTAHQDCKIRVWRISSSKRHQLFSTLPTVKDRLIRSMVAKNYVQVRRHKQKLWIEHADVVSGLAVVKQGMMYSVSWDKSFKVWRTSDLCCIESIKAHEDAINAIVVSFDGTVYTGSADGHIRVWKSANGGKKHELAATLKKHNSSVNSIALNEDGSMLFSGGCDQVILVWEREEEIGGEIHMLATRVLRGHRGAILCLSYVDGYLISGSSDRTIRVWKYERGLGYSCAAVLEGHSKPVKSLVAVSSGEENKDEGYFSIFSASIDGVIKVWQVHLTCLSSTSSTPVKL